MKKGIHPDYHFVEVQLNDGTTYQDCHAGGCKPESNVSCLPGGSKGWRVDIGLAWIRIPDGSAQIEIAWMRCWGPG